MENIDLCSWKNIGFSTHRRFEPGRVRSIPLCKMFRGPLGEPTFSEKLTVLPLGATI